MTGTLPLKNSVDAVEVEKFSRIAAEWWDPDGKFAPLHKFNPVRLQFIRDIAAQHFARDARSLKPFAGLSLLDIGCGGGLLCEPTAKLGFTVCGVDPSVQNIDAACAHVQQTNLSIDYRATDAETLASSGASFDVVLNMEVVEHVSDLHGYISATAQLVKPGGIMFVATINKTLKSLALAKVMAEYVLRWLPPGTHDWNKFVEPQALAAMLKSADLQIVKTQGIAFDPLGWVWHLSRDQDVNYMIVAQRALAS